MSGYKDTKKERKKDTYTQGNREPTIPMERMATNAAKRNTPVPLLRIKSGTPATDVS